MEIHYCIQSVWAIFLALNVASSVFQLLISFRKAPWYFFTLLSASINHFERAPCYILPYSVQDDTQRIIGYSTVKIDRVSGWYWFYYKFCDIEQKNSLFGIVYWTMMTILYLFCFILKCYVLSFFSQISNQWCLGIFCHKFLRQSKKYINFNFRFWSTEPTFIFYFLVNR